MSNKESRKNLAFAEESDDEEDEDYVPENLSDEEENEEFKNSKRKMSGNESEDDDPSLTKSKKDEILPVNEEDKKKADELWANFLKDVKHRPAKTVDYAKKYQNPIESKKTPTPSTNKPKTDFFSAYETEKETDAEKSEITETAAITDAVNKDVKRKKPMGMAAILEKINNNEKLSTLEKSKIDWNDFKKEKKIEEDLATQVKGKNSYLDKQAFLERADQRQFELEKEMRNKERKRRDAKF